MAAVVAAAVGVPISIVLVDSFGLFSLRKKYQLISVNFGSCFKVELAC